MVDVEDSTYPATEHRSLLVTTQISTISAFYTERGNDRPEFLSQLISTLVSAPEVMCLFSC